MAHENDYDTTVLSDDYGDYYDTVVDQVVAFDPKLFEQSAAAGSAVGGMPVPPPKHDPDEDTWVLGSGSAPQPSAPPQPARASAPSAAPAATAQFALSAQAPVSYTTSTMMAAADNSPARTNTKLIIVIATLAVVAVAAIIVVVALLLGSGGSRPSSSSAPAVAATASSSSAASALSGASASSDAAAEQEPEPERSAAASYKTGTTSAAIVVEGNGRATSESELYALLSEYYDLAGDYDTSVRSSAEEFNATFLKEDKAARNAKASAVATLRSKIRSSWDDLKKVELPFMSKNTQAYRDLCECYECLYRRIDVIDQAWKISLQYDKPKEHESEIVAPLRAQQVNGNDKYYTRFKELYPQINLVKP